MEPSEDSSARRRPSWSTITACVFAALFALTAVVPDWLEAVGVEGLDAGDGSAEGVLLVVLGVLAVVSGVVALRASLGRRAVRT